MDVPFFLYGGFALAVGRGDRIFPLAAAPELPLVLLIPEFEIPTAGCLPEPSRASGAAAGRPRSRRDW